MNTNEITKEELLKKLHQLELENTALKKSFEDHISNLKECDEIQRKTNNKHLYIIDRIPDGVYKSTPEGKFIYVNDSLVKMLGYDSKEELMAIDIKNQLYFEISDRDSSVLQENKKELGVYKLKKKDGSELWVEDHGWITHDESTDELLNEGIIRDITERKESEQLLQIEHDKLVKIANQIPGFVYQYRLYPDGSSCFPYVSDGIKEIYRVTPEEVIKDASKAWERAHPDDLESLTVTIQKSANELSPWKQEYRVKFDDGSVNTLFGNALPQSEIDGSVLWHGYIYDITERKLSEEKLRKLSQAVEQSPVTIIITDTKGYIQYVNPKFVETTGYSVEEVLGKHTRVLKSGYSTPEEYEELWKTISSGADWHGEFKNMKKDGELYWESATISPIINTAGETTHFIAIKEEISYRKESEILLKQKTHEIEVQNEEYKHLNEELIQAKEHAEESDRLKSAFLANMSHEIRTPMNGILGFAGLLKEPMLTGEQQKEYIDIIEKSGVRMLSIINDIIDISKIESGLMKVKMEESNINDQIEYISTFFKPEVESKGMKFSAVKSLDSDDSIIKTDSEKVYAILINLVKNAIKYSNSGFIEFGYFKKGEYLEFFVKDTGNGIPKNRQKAIFERFVQADIEDKMAEQGAGLGLSISKAFTKMLGGKIWLESEEGKGSTFYFTVPYIKNTQEKSAVENFIIDNEIVSHLKKIKILIAEDDKISRLFINKAVQAFSKETLNVVNGAEAVEVCRNNKDIDLVLMDIKMPLMDGYEATTAIRQFNKDIIIIAQSAYGLTGDVEKAIRSGCNTHISKPINKHDFLVLIQKYFS